MGYRSHSIAVSRDMGPLRPEKGVITKGVFSLEESLESLNSLLGHLEWSRSCDFWSMRALWSDCLGQTKLFPSRDSIQEPLNAPFLNGLFSNGFSTWHNGPLRRNRGNAPLRVEHGPLRRGNGPLRPRCWLAFQSAAYWAVFRHPFSRISRNGRILLYFPHSAISLTSLESL